MIPRCQYHSTVSVLAFCIKTYIYIVWGSQKTPTFLHNLKNAFIFCVLPKHNTQAVQKVTIFSNLLFLTNLQLETNSNDDFAKKKNKKRKRKEGILLFELLCRDPILINATHSCTRTSTLVELVTFAKLKQRIFLPFVYKRPQLCIFWQLVHGCFSKNKK